VINRNQKIALIIGAILLTLATLFPPWLWTWSIEGGSRSEVAIGCSFLFAPPAGANTGRAFGVKIDLARLSTELFAVMFLTGTAVLVLGRSGRET
jgi:ABC-type multidrug transport system fused ATPase/permease subunit